MSTKSQWGSGYACSYEVIGAIALAFGLIADQDVPAARVRLAEMLVTRPREEEIDSPEWPQRFAHRRLQQALSLFERKIVSGTRTHAPKEVMTFVKDLCALMRESYDIAVARHSARPASNGQMPPTVKAPWVLVADADEAKRAAAQAAIEADVIELPIIDV